jgi:hypothetical protein
VVEHVPSSKLYQIKTPVEVSVCREGRRATCNILGYIDTDKRPAPAAETPSNNEIPTHTANEDSQNKRTKTTNLYNAGKTEISTSNLKAFERATPSSPKNELYTVRRSVTMSANNSSNNMETVPTLPPTPELVMELNRERQEKAVMAQKLAALEAEQAQRQAQLEAQQKEFRERTLKELDSLATTFIEKNGLQKTPEMDQVMEPLRQCRNPDEMLTSFKTLFSDSVMASSDYADKLAAANKKIEELTTNHYAQQYHSFANQKFASPDTRYQTPLQPKVAPSTPSYNPTPSFPTSGVFYNPKNGSVASPISTPTPAAAPTAPQQQQQQQGGAPGRDANGFPVINNWSHHQWNPTGYPGMNNSFHTHQSTEVKANSNFKPGAAGSIWNPVNGGFSLGNMPIMHTEESGETRKNLNSAYDGLVKGVTDAASHQAQRY